MTGKPPIRDRYQLLRPLGARGAKKTWLAEDLTTGSQVTVKVLSFGPGMDWQDFKLFEREGQTLQHLDHPRIPRYLDFFRLKTPQVMYYCLVQTYIPGQSLAEVVRAGKRFSQSEVETIATSLLQVLIYLHGHSPPVIHRDIKPSNLIQAETEEQSQPQIYVIDFGSVQAESASGRTATVVGTYGYMPMEQFGGRAVPASDLYALGATLVFLLSGTDPADLPQTNLKPQLGSILSVEPSFQRWLEQMLEPGLEQRFPSATVALHALRDRALGAYRGSTLVPSSGAQPPAQTGIQIACNPERLRITIPPRRGGASLGFTLLAGFSIFQLAISGFQFIIFLAFSFFSPFSLITLLWQGIWIALWYYLMRYSFKHRRRNWGFNTIDMDPQTFKISWSHFGPDKLPHRTRAGMTGTIEGVEVALGNEEGEICLMARSEQELKMYPMALGLTTQERYWLVSEIRQWLSAARSR